MKESGGTYTLTPFEVPLAGRVYPTPFGVDDSYDKAEARRLLAEHTSDDYGYEG